MSEQLSQILQQYAVGNGGDKRKTVWHTHVSQVQPKGSYAFNSVGLESFWHEYCELVSRVANPMIGLAEKPKDYGPVIADIDLKIEQPESTNLSEPFYTQDQILETIDAYQTVLRQIVDGCTDHHLICLLLERPPYRPSSESPTVKNGFHLHFPNLFLSANAQRVHLLPRVRDLIDSLETFGDFVEKSSSVVDDVTQKHWLLYGSKKNEAREPYLLTKIYNYECNEISLDEAFKNHVIYDMQEEAIKIRGNIEYYLPRILSTFQHHRPCLQIKKGITCPVLERKTRSTSSNKPTMDVADALRIAGQLLPMLSERRAIDRDEWMAIGWALFNIGGGCHEALDLWLQHSQRSVTNYDETSCIDAWNKMTPKGVTIATLYYYAEIDNPKLYQEFKTERVEHHLKQAITGSHHDIARILHAEHGNEFVCASIKTNMWYQFVSHRWKEIEVGTYLRAKIPRDVVARFTKIGKQYMSNLGDSDETGSDKFTNSKIDRVTKLIGNLKNNGFQNAVMAEAAHVFYDERFKDMLDQNENLVAFQNGVYDLKRNVFRAGRPEDFISKALPISYMERNESDDEVQEVFDFLEKVFPDKSIRQFWLDVYSDIFVGGNSRKIVVFWTGEGDNGKSITQHLLEDMLGDLSVKLPTTLFSGQKVKAGQANPEMARLAPPARSGTAEEPDGGEAMNIGLIKSMSGGDKIGVRDLYQAGKTIRDMKPMFMLTFICNKLPRIRQSDGAFWNRIKVIPYETTFVKPGQPCPESYEEQLATKRFPMDMHFSSRIPDLLSPLAWVLLEHRKKPSLHFEPEKVREATNRYRRQNDDYRRFIQDKIIEDIDARLPLDELFTQYRFWFNDCYPNRRHESPDRDTVQDYFVTTWGSGAFNRNKFIGYRIRGIEDDLAGEEVEVSLESLVEYTEDRNIDGESPI